MTCPLLLALFLASVVDAAAAAEAPADAPPDAPHDAGIMAAPDRADRAPRPGLGGWRHALGLGLHSTTFFSERGSQYTFHSASIGYHGSVGARGLFLDAFALVTLQARQDGRVYATGDYYRRRWGGDLLFGWHWRWSGRGLEAEAGPGLHATLISLPGKAGYRDFSALPLGLGAGGLLWWRTGAALFSRVVAVGTYASAAFDFYDPAHADDLAHGFTFRAGVAVGLGARR